MGLKQVKGVYSGVYLSQTMWNQAKDINEKAQTANFSVLARGRRSHKELLAKKHGKLGQLKRKLLKILNRYDLSRVVPYASGICGNETPQTI